ncbi:MAG: immunoglobulin-like domain-containing protein [Treponema sp.]
MKHVSRVLFGLSIAAVLSLVTACSQANDTKSSQGIPAALTKAKAETGDAANEIKLSAEKVAVDAYTYAKITAKENGAGADIAFTFGMMSSATEHKCPKAQFDANVKAGIVAKMPKANTKYTFTVELLKEEAGKKPVVLARSMIQGISKADAQQGGGTVTKESLNTLAADPLVKAALTAALTAGDTEASVTKNFTITNPTDAKFTGVTFAWSSSENAISFTGNVATVQRPANSAADVNCDISVTLTKDGVSSDAKKVATLTVKKADAQQGGGTVTKESLNTLAADPLVKAALTAALTAGDTEASVTKNFTITNPTDAKFTGVTFAWSSSENAISFTGNVATVQRPANSAADVNCDISVTLTKDGVSSDAKKVATLTVKKADAQQGGGTVTKESLNTLAADPLVKAALTAALTAGDTEASVTKNFTITNPTDAKFTGVTFAWSSSENAISFTGNVATVQRPANSAADVNCDISVTLTKDGVSSDAKKVATLTVKKQ